MRDEVFWANKIHWSYRGIVKANANAAYGLYYCRYNGSGAGFFTRWNSYSKYHLILKLKEDGFDADEFDANYNGAITIRWKE